MTAKRKIALLTKPFRHRLVRIVAPTIYQSHVKFVRPMIQFVKEHNGDSHELVGVEIGVAAGENAASILENLPIKKLFLVDPYQPYYQNGRYMHQFTDKYGEAKTRLATYKDKVEFILFPSHEAAGHIPDNLDFVYIDGNHSYSYVKRDITLYYPKIVDEGIIGGHDFTLAFSGVVNATLEFAGEHGFTLQGAKHDWWIVKGAHKE